MTVALFALAGCAKFQPRPISPAETAADWDKRSLDSEPFHQFLQKNLQPPPANWPLKTWDMDSLTLAALYFHPSLEVARAQWEELRSGEITAGQRPNPSVSVSPGYDFTATSLGQNAWLPGLTFDIPVETMGKRGYRKAQARQLSESARLNIAATAWQVRNNLRASLVELTAAKRRVELLKSQELLQQQVVNLLDERVKAGAATSSEASLVTIALKKTQVDLADARRQESDGHFHLADAIGIPASALDGVEIQFDLKSLPGQAQELTSSQARDLALKSRADILAALADYNASQSALQLQVAKQYPDVHFGPYYQYNQGDHQFTLSATLELPILNQNQGPIAEAAAHRSEMAARFLALQSKVIGDIDRAVAGCRVAVENLAVVESLEKSQKSQGDSIAAQAEAGAVDQLDLANSKVELAASRLIELDGQFKAQQAYSALEDALQHPINAINPATIESPATKPVKEKTP